MFLVLHHSLFAFRTQWDSGGEATPLETIDGTPVNYIFRLTAIRRDVKVSFSRVILFSMYIQHSNIRGRPRTMLSGHGSF